MCVVWTFMNLEIALFFWVLLLTLRWFILDTKLWQYFYVVCYTCTSEFLWYLRVIVILNILGFICKAISRLLSVPNLGVDLRSEWLFRIWNIYLIFKYFIIIVIKFSNRESFGFNLCYIALLYLLLLLIALQLTFFLYCPVKT